MSTKKSPTITTKQYSVLDEAYKHFNKALFKNELPDCMLLLHRKGKNNLGYYHPERFMQREEVSKFYAKKIKKKDIHYIDELSLNPDNFIGYSDTAILSVLAHEMCHVWQYRCTDKYPRNGYHDKVWGRKMEEIGLMPSNTGAESGKKTGQQMHHYIIQGGKFEASALIFLKKNTIAATSFQLEKNSTSQKKNKQKYTCPSCEQNAWAKPDASLKCGECDEYMEAV